MSRAPLSRWCVLALLTILSGATALAAPPMRIAVMPPRDLGLGPDAVAELEHAIVEAVSALPGFSVANLSANGRLAAAKGLSALEQPAARAQALAQECSASRVLLVDVARLGDGHVVYLQGIDPKSGTQIGSTTASLSNERPPTAADRIALRGAVVRVFDPSQYLGRVALKLDVKGAEVQVDGRPLVADFTKPLELPVGTHALRVTHPAYHDFLRFIDVVYAETVSLDVPLAAYPLTEGEMAERQRRSVVVVARPKIKWYRTWWALTLAGVVLTGATTGIVFAARPDIAADRLLSYRWRPSP